VCCSAQCKALPKKKGDTWCRVVAVCVVQRCCSVVAVCCSAQCEASPTTKGDVWCNIVAVLCECVAGRSRTHTKMRHVWCSVVQCVAMLLHCGGCVSHLQIDRFPANSKVICSLRNDAHQVLSCHVAYIDKSCQTHINESCHANHDTCGHVWYCHIISYSYIRHIIVARYVCTHI